MHLELQSIGVDAPVIGMHFMATSEVFLDSPPVLKRPGRRLFREEALAAQEARLAGNVHLIVPLAWQLVGGAMCMMLVLAGIFLAVAPYPRTETASGSIAAEQGVLNIMPSKPGVIEDVLVGEGQRVEAGMPLVRIRVDDFGNSGQRLGPALKTAIAEQHAKLLEQANGVGAAARAMDGQAEASMAGLRSELDSLHRQLDLQSSLESRAKQDAERLQDVAKNGFLSLRDLRTAEEKWLTHQQQSLQIRSALAAKRAALVEAERGRVRASADANAQLASLAAARAELAQREASTDAGSTYVLTAPKAGRVSALNARLGQTLNGQDVLMLLVPGGSRLHAELDIPAAAIAFIRPGQLVRLKVDAFPYEKYGTFDGRIASVSGATINRQAPDGTRIAVYPATVRLLKPTRDPGERETRRLLPGMSVSARITTDRQPLMQWFLASLKQVK